MSASVLSLSALAAVIVLSSRKGFHAGAGALALAILIGRFALNLDAKSLAALFPSELLLMLLGVTLLFTMAKANGTLDVLVQNLLGASNCRPWLLPILFFLLTLTLSMLGAGNIGAVALMAPVALETARRAGVGAELTSFMLVTGANAGAFSPLAFTGVIAGALTRRAGLELSPWGDIFAPSLAAQSGLALAGYALAWPALQRSRSVVRVAPPPAAGREQKLTLAALAALAGATLWLQLDVGLTALLLAAVLGLASAADENRAIGELPWSAIVMVCGASTLVAVASRGGGMDVLAGWLSRAGDEAAVTGTTAFFAAFTSIYSSSSGVVMPAFLSMVPEIAEHSGARPVVLAAAINVSSHLVDISPLSTLGALCVAAVPEAERGPVFQRLFYGGLAMSVFAALLGYLVFGRLA
jgi:di/tricarboxylate transporter